MMVKVEKTMINAIKAAETYSVYVPSMNVHQPELFLPVCLVKIKAKHKAKVITKMNRCVSQDSNLRA
jgi:hypothetical protein